MGDKGRILVVDDQPEIRRVLRLGLVAEGYDVRVAEDGASALQVLGDWNAEAVITDLSMPHMDGIELCRRLRAHSQVPVIVLSVRQEEEAKLEAFHAGADDYVTKPFSINELLARLKANLRRAGSAEGLVQVIEAGDFRADLQTHKIWVRQVELRLTPKEFDLLVFFLKRPGKLATHASILTAIWGPENVRQSEYLRTFIAQLRKKIESDIDGPRYLVTEPRIGYRFEPGE